MILFHIIHPWRLWFCPQLTDAQTPLTQHVSVIDSSSGKKTGQFSIRYMHAPPGWTDFTTCCWRILWKHFETQGWTRVKGVTSQIASWPNFRQWSNSVCSKSFDSDFIDDVVGLMLPIWERLNAISLASHATIEHFLLDSRNHFFAPVCSVAGTVQTHLCQWKICLSGFRWCVSWSCLRRLFPSCTDRLQT